MVRSIAKPRRITVCGCGLIGGSITLDLQKKSRGATTIVAYDKPTVLSRLKNDRRFKTSVETDFGKAVTGSNLIILAATHKANQTILTKLARARSLTDCLILDTGGVKEPIARLAADLSFPEGVQFLPSHPMSGRERAGFENAQAGLFKARAWFFDENFTISRRNRLRLAWLMNKTGGLPVYLSSCLHDELIAELSHLPQLISTTLGAQIDRGMVPLSGPGLRSMLRLSGSPYRVWSEIIDQNREKIVESLRLYADNLSNVADLIEKRISLKDIFGAAARSYRCL